MIKYLAAAGIAAMAIAAPVSAVVVYDTGTGLAGNQAYGGTLGMDFTVNSKVKVTSLGAFDSLSDGISTNIFVAIFDAGGTLITPILNFNGTKAVPGSSYAFQSIAPIILAPGTYQLGAWGYNGTDQNFNNSGSGGPIVFNSLGGKLTALGTRYGSEGTPGVLATIEDFGLTRYGGPSFTATDVPEPATWALLISGFAMVGFAMRRRGTPVASA